MYVYNIDSRTNYVQGPNICIIILLCTYVTFLGMCGSITDHTLHVAISVIHKLACNLQSARNCYCATVAQLVSSRRQGVWLVDGRGVGGREYGW